jgi:hypothetical protein
LAQASQAARSTSPSALTTRKVISVEVAVFAVMMPAMLALLELQF